MMNMHQLSGIKWHGLCSSKQEQYVQRDIRGRIQRGMVGPIMLMMIVVLGGCCPAPTQSAATHNVIGHSTTEHDDALDDDAIDMVWVGKVVAQKKLANQTVQLQVQSSSPQHRNSHNGVSQDTAPQASQKTQKKVAQGTPETTATLTDVLIDIHTTLLTAQGEPCDVEALLPGTVVWLRGKATQTAIQVSHQSADGKPRTLVTATEVRVLPR